MNRILETAAAHAAEYLDGLASRPVAAVASAEELRRRLAKPLPGFLIVPSDLRDRLVAARRAADQHPPVLDQAVLADFIREGHFARHLRRMRTAYRQRLEALVAAVERYCGGALRLRPVQTGLHAVADLDGVDAVRVSAEAHSRGIEATPLAAYSARPARAANGLALGFAAARPDVLRRGADQLAAAIEAARRSS